MKANETAFSVKGLLCPGPCIGMRRAASPPCSISITKLFCSLAAVCLWPLAASSQSRLEQLESTYQTNLRALHAPLLQEYIRQLDVLKTQFLGRNRLTDAQQVDSEIARVKTIATTTGVLPFSATDTAAMEAKDSAPQPSPPVASPSAVRAKSARSPLPTFLAADVSNGVQASGKSGAVALGSAEWRISKLPPGTYDVLMVFSTAALPLPEQVKLDVGGHAFSAVIPADRATGSPDTFRLLRLCRITLDAAVNDGTLTLTAAAGEQPRVWIRKLIFAEPKDPEARPAK